MNTQISRRTSIRDFNRLDRALRDVVLNTQWQDTRMVLGAVAMLLAKVVCDWPPEERMKIAGQIWETVLEDIRNSLL